MRLFPTLVLLTLLASATGAGAQPADPHMEHALRVLRTTPLIDGHNDVAWEIRTNAAAPGDVVRYGFSSGAKGQTDAPRLRQGHVGALYLSVYTPGEWADSGYARVQLEQIDTALRLIDANPETLEFALTADDVERIFKEGRIGAMLGLEGGHAIESSLGALRAYHRLGVRYMTLTHNVTLDWVDAAMDAPRSNGLSPFGEDVVREMNRLGMLVDLSHASPATMSEVLDVSRAPIIFSHSSARALVDVPRNVPDSILARMPANGGVVMITFVPPFVSREVSAFYDRYSAVRDSLSGTLPGGRREAEAAMPAWLEANPAPRATLGQVADHIEHVRRVAGVDAVGIGSDFDGITMTPVGLEDVSTFPNLFAELSRRGWSESDLRKLAGENVLRVMRAAEGVSGKMQQEERSTAASASAADE